MEWNAFRDKVVLITGSSRGIGNTIARKFAQAGADVVINYRQKGGRSQGQAELLRQEIQEIGRRAYLIQADVSLKQSVKQMFSEVKEHMRPARFSDPECGESPF